MFQVRMLVNMLADQIFDFLNLTVEEGDMLAQISANSWVEGTGFKATDLLGAYAVQIFQIAHQPAQFTEGRVRRRPQGRLLGAAEVGNHPRVGLVSLVAPQLALGIGFDPRWIDHADRVTLRMQILGQIITISSSGFHAGVKLFDILLLQPVSQLAKPFRAIGKHSMNALAFMQQHHIKLGF